MFLLRLEMDKTFHIPIHPTIIIAILSPKAINCHSRDSDFSLSPDRSTVASFTKESGLTVGAAAESSPASVGSLFPRACRLGEEVGTEGASNDCEAGVVGVLDGLELGCLVGKRVGGVVGKLEE